ncbi:MAG TPA: tetratricopeptide repeat protein [Vicinamibacterales bacterium]|nr:tetratricopeptide repeat protein [Vicinamibacterales bacterium]
MPPWKPDPGVADFIGDRRLPEEEIDRIVRWVREGAVEGNRADLPAAPPSTGSWLLGTPDLVLQVPAYEMPGGGQDQFRNFVVAVPLQERRFVRGLELHPNGRQIHHANIFVDSTDTSRELDEEDPSPGYEGVVPYTASFPDGHFLGWTPGQVAPLLPEEQSWRLPPGSSLLVQMHLMADEQPRRVQATIGLYFSKTPPVRTPAMLRLGRQNLDIPPGDRAYVSTDSYVLPVDVQVQAVQPHAHHRARSVRAWASLPGGGHRDLIAISDWDFGWQDQYRYVGPFWLPKGTTLTAEYSFDNSIANRRNPDSPPRRVLWGQRSSDEMADVWVQMLTRSEADRQLLTTDVRTKMLLEDVAGHELELRSKPESILVRNDLAVLYLELGRPLQAAAQFAAVSRLQPGSAEARFNLAAALDRAGRRTEAIEHYSHALALKPTSARALKALGTALLVSGRFVEARDPLRTLVGLDPSDAEAFNNLGFCQLQTGEIEAAIASLERALALRPSYADAHYNLARALGTPGTEERAAQHLREALQARADWVPAMTELAWLLTTASDRRVRQPREAVRLAAAAAAITRREDAEVLAVLGAALAADGQYGEAVKVGEAALNVAPEDARARITAQVQAYRARRPLQASQR